VPSDKRLRQGRANGNNFASVTITYVRTNGTDFPCTRVGYGENVKEAISDCDNQLPLGTWIRQSVSTSQTIYSDLEPRRIFSIDHVRGSRMGEGEQVIRA
jgi:hypothetical protein